MPAGMSNPTAIRWTDHAVAYLKAHWDTMSAREIALALGTGHSRLAVVGKAHRLGLASKSRDPRPGRPVERINSTLRRMGPMRSLSPVAKYQEPPMPQVNDAQKLHARQYGDLEPGMCNWPVYVEQGVQMYCAAATERLPGRHDIYCPCHGAMGRQPLKPRQSRGTWR